MNLNMKFFLMVFILMLVTSIGQADILLKDIQGHTISFSSLKGRWILINYWADWCKTCIEEIPELNRFYQKHEKGTVTLFAVNYDGLPLYKQQKLIKKFNILYPSLTSNPAFALGLGDITGVPVTFIINPAGKLVHALYGKQDIKSLDLAIEHTTSFEKN